DLKKIKDKQIQVNHPLQFDGFSVYQVDYTSQFEEMSFRLENKDSGESFGTFSVDLLSNQKETYNLGDGYKVNLLAYFPDFYFDEDDEPATKSQFPNNPT